MAPSPSQEGHFQQGDTKVWHHQPSEGTPTREVKGSHLPNKGVTSQPTGHCQWGHLPKGTPRGVMPPTRGHQWRSPPSPPRGSCPQYGGIPSAPEGGHLPSKGTQQGGGSHLSDAAMEGGVGGGAQGGLSAPQVQGAAQVEPLALAGRGAFHWCGIVHHQCPILVKSFSCHPVPLAQGHQLCAPQHCRACGDRGSVTGSAGGQPGMFTDLRCALGDAWGPE